MPPWAHQFDVFSDLCDGCADCVTICPKNIISIDRQNHAKVSFQNNFCDFCGKCEQVCAPKALDRNHNPAWTHMVKFKAGCLSSKGITCRLCEESCPTQAIRFSLLPAGRSIPLIDQDKCNGCGACQAACPADAVYFTQPQKEPL